MGSQTHDTFSTAFREEEVSLHYRGETALSGGAAVPRPRRLAERFLRVATATPVAASGD